MRVVKDILSSLFSKNGIHLVCEFLKNNILKFLLNKCHYILTTILLIIVFILAFINNYNYFTYEIVSLTFVLLVVLVSLKVSIGNSVLL